jgi:ankyrin repeat protein
MGLAACLDDLGAGGGDLVELAATAQRAELAAALDAAGPEAVANLRYGAQSGLAHAAVSNKANPDAIAQVNEAGADVNLIDANGRTPLHYAIELQSDAAVLALLKLGANPDIQTGSGQSPRAFCQDALKQVPDFGVCQKMLDSLR